MALRSPLAPFACALSRGRLHPTSPSPTRGEHQRDRDRVIHSAAFRRLAHKTQVFVAFDGDHFRTRLTHSIEVGQIARALARALALNEDLAEAVALAHDLGHAPFGHAGEGALAACMRPYGGFDHNVQALRVVTLLERCYADHDGLNLTFETLEGIVKHNGPLAGPLARRPTPDYIARFDAAFPLELETFAAAEAQCAALADDIAYTGHDLDDGLRGGLFTLQDLGAVAFAAELLAEIEAWRPGLETTRAIHELTRRVITRLVEDAIGESAARLARCAPHSPDEARRAGAPLVGFSPPMTQALAEIKRFLFRRMYRHERILPVWEQARAAISRLFDAFMSAPALLPPEWAAQSGEDGEDARARIVADYIAGMTDRYALREAERVLARP